MFHQLSYLLLFCKESYDLVYTKIKCQNLNKSHYQGQEKAHIVVLHCKAWFAFTKAVTEVYTTGN